MAINKLWIYDTCDQNYYTIPLTFSRFDSLPARLDSVFEGSLSSSPTRLAEAPLLQRACLAPLWLLGLGLELLSCDEPRLNVQTWPFRGQRPHHDGPVWHCPAGNICDMLDVGGLCVKCLFSGLG